MRTNCLIDDFPCSHGLHLVDARSKAWVCGRSLAGIAGSNPASGMDDCTLWMLCFVRYTSLWRADLSYRGVIPVSVRVNFSVTGWNGNPLRLHGVQRGGQTNGLLVAVIVLLYVPKKQIASRKTAHFSHCKPPSVVLTSQFYEPIT